MVKFRGMGRNGFVTAILIFLCFSSTCDASLVSHLRKLIDDPPANASTNNSQISPVKSPVNVSNTSMVDTDKSTTKKHEEPGMSDQNDSSTIKSNNNTITTDSNNTTKNSDNVNNNKTLPVDSKGFKSNETSNNNSATPSPPLVTKNDSDVDGGGENVANESKQKLDNRTCVGSLTSCRGKAMLACIEISKGSKDMVLVVHNEGESSLKVNLRPSNSLQNALPAFDVPKHENRRMELPSTVGKNPELIVDTGDTKCTLHLSHPVSVDDLIQQLSFYSKQVTPIYAVYALFLLSLLFGGAWACCKLRKRGRENGIPYQELEMALPESTSNVNVVSAEGWDDDWDDDDWDEENAVRSPSMRGVRSLSADGLTSRTVRKDGWDDDWDD